MTDARTSGKQTAAAEQSDATAKPKPLVGSLVHGLSIIMAFDKSDPEMTLTQVAEKTGMDRAGARRYLLTLAALGFVSQSGRLFRLTPKVMDLGYAYLSSMPLADKAQYYLDRIRDRTGFPMALGVLDGDHIVHVASANTDDLLSPALTIGRRFPLGYSSAGRSILANLDEAAREALLADVRLEAATETALTSVDALRDELARIREQGHALVDQELATGVRSLAVPILSQGGEVVASFNTYTFTSIVSLDRLLAEALPEMKDAAAEIGRTLT